MSPGSLKTDHPSLFADYLPVYRTVGLHYIAGHWSMVDFHFLPSSQDNFWRSLSCLTLRRESLRRESYIIEESTSIAFWKMLSCVWDQDTFLSFCLNTQVICSQGPPVRLSNVHPSPIPSPGAVGIASPYRKPSEPCQGPEESTVTIPGKSYWNSNK